MKVETGYLIRRTLKEEHKKSASGDLVDGGPEYLHPPEGYKRLFHSRLFQPASAFRLGWHTPEEAQSVLARVKKDAEEQGYSEQWNWFDHVIVKMTVIEEKVYEGDTGIGGDVEILEETITSLNASKVAKIGVLCEDGKVLPLSGRVGWGCSASAKRKATFCEDCPGRPGQGNWDCLAEFVFLGAGKPLKKDR